MTRMVKVEPQGTRVLSDVRLKNNTAWRYYPGALLSFHDQVIQVFWNEENL
jgi:hypothetical protein